jgi:hypothetical protein
MLLSIRLVYMDTVQARMANPESTTVSADIAMPMNGPPDAAPLEDERFEAVLEMPDGFWPSGEKMRWCYQVNETS